MAFKVHPGIGIARVGNSPSEWFLGPETFELPPLPPGGYRDAECRIKRQAARFRIWEYGTSGTAPPTEITADEATITWKVRLKLGSSFPAEISVTGPNQTAQFAPVLGSSFSLGEIRTDSRGRLIVLSGVIAGGSDGRCDGYVKADVTKPGAAPSPALESRVVICPPDFCPQTRPVLTYYHRLLHGYLDAGTFTGLSAPSTPSFRQDVYPILLARRFAATKAAESGLPFLGGEMARAALADLPAMPGPFVFDHDLTPTQWQLLKAWVQGTFVDDWPAPGTPAPDVALTPEVLDRGPLSHAVGGPLGGWELGTLPVATASLAPTTSIYVEPFRFDPAKIDYGDILPSLPWQSDLAACTGEWPSQAGPGSYAGGANWQTRGFLVLQGDGFALVEDCAEPYVVLLTNILDFGEVRQGPGETTTYHSLPIVFEVGSLTAPAVFTLDASTFPPGISAATLSVSQAALSVGEFATVKLWVTYATGSVGSELFDTISVQHVGGEAYPVVVSAATAAAARTKLALVLDCSTSMTNNRGDGLSKLQGLKEAVGVIIDVARQNDGIGVSPFSTNALTALPVTLLGPNVTGEPKRAAVRAFVNGLTVDDLTSIGDGLVSARTVLASAPDPYEQEAVVVVTDGKETAAEYIADVEDTIDQRTFAIGIGMGNNVDASTLQTLSGNRGGYLLLTGSPVAASNQFTLEKHLLQILSGANNDELIVDPEGTVPPQGTVKIPFSISDAEASFDAIVVSDEPERLGLALQLPNGETLRDSVVGGLTQVHFMRGDRVCLFRVRLDAGRRFAPGSWQLLIEQRASSDERLSLRLGRNRDNRQRKSLAYCAVVSARSALRSQVTLQQPRLTPGADVLLEAQFTLRGAPFLGRLQVVADVMPTGDLPVQQVALQPAEPGRFVGSYKPVRPGMYHVRFRSRGRLPSGSLFQREFMASATVQNEPITPPAGRQLNCRDVQSLLDSVCRCLRFALGKQLSSWGRIFKVQAK